MRIFLTDNLGKKIRMGLPYQSARFVTPAADSGGYRCPRCDAPLKARMPHPQRRHDGFDGDAICYVDGCGYVVGKMVVKLDTIFGVEEDERVLNGRCRVY